jgi:hypothetical protein
MSEAPRKSPRKKAGPRLFFLTNRMNALPVLSCGLAQPALGLSKVYDDLFTATPGRLPLWVGPCPSNLDVVISGGRDGVFPVAFEVDPRRLAIPDAPTLSAEWGLSSGRLDGSLPDCRCIVPEIVIPACSIVQLHFRSEAELVEFTSRDFGNTDLGAVRTAVTPAVFDGPPADLDRLKAAMVSLPKGERLTAELLRSADALAGAVAMLTAELPSGRNWSDAVEGLLQAEAVARGSSNAATVVKSLLDACGWTKAGDSAAGVDMRFLRSALRFLVGSRPTGGWVSGAFVGAVAKGALEGAADVERRDIDSWAKYASEVARADRQPMALDDSGSIVRRALILLMLRPDPDRLVKSRSSTLQPGDEVLATAAVMCGALQGLSMLPKAMKARPAFRTSLPGVMSEWVNRRAGAGNAAAVGLKLKGTVELTEEQAPLARIVVRIAGDTVAERTVQPADSLMRVFYKAKQLGLDITYDWELKAFKVRLALGGDRQQIVLISEGRRDKKGRLAIRFVSPCHRLGRSGLRREQAIDLLRRNGSMDLDCRYSISEDEQYVVVQAEQLLDTMDIDELQAHVEHVAQVADEYEQANGQTDLF